MEDLAEGTFVEKIPGWLRWILVIPSAILMPVIILVIQYVSSLFFGNATADSFWFEIVREVILGAGFVYGGAWMAPKKQFFVGVLLLVFTSLFVGVSILATLMGYGTLSPFEAITGYILNLVAAIGVVLYLHGKNLH